MRICFFLFILLGYINRVPAAGFPATSSEILHALQKLNTVGSVMYIAAHPDDENTRLLSWLAGERHMRTVYLSLTRGDGGQNLIGNEQGDMLGLIRTEELLAARRTDGAEQWFTRAVDFGYSKNPEETFRFWNREKVLSDVVFAIRKFKPDVIICRFPTTGEGGHGHHTASAILAEQAFDMAADPSKFPEQLALVEIWQPKRLFWNTFNFGGNNTTAADQLKLDVGGYNPLLGKSYGEIAALSRTCHKSQGFGSASQRGSQFEYFKQIKGDKVSKDLFEGINTGWSRIIGSKGIQKQINAILKSYNSAAPEASVHKMVKLYTALRGLIASHEKQTIGTFNADYTFLTYKISKLKSIIAASAGLWLETTAADYRLVPGHPMTLNTQVLCRTNVPVRLDHVSFVAFKGAELLPDSLKSIKLKVDKPVAFSAKGLLYEGLKVSSPYWLEYSEAGWQVPFDAEIGMPVQDFWQLAEYVLNIDGYVLNYVLPVTYKSVDPVKGELHRPLEILPPVTVTPSENTVIMHGNKAQKITYSIRANADSVSGYFYLSGANSYNYSLAETKFALVKKGDEILIDKEISLNEDKFEGYLQGIVKLDGKSNNNFYGIREITYDHIPKRMVLYDNRVLIRKIDMNNPVKSIAYVPGAGDHVASCLAQLGIRVEIVKPENLGKTDLSVFDAVITGIRAYNSSDAIAQNQKYLLDYVKQGGRLLVQYNTNSRVGPLQSGIGPYPFTISRNRVTDEKSEIAFVNDTLPVLNSPNKINAADFNGWVQERGVYFASELDSAFSTVLQLKDPGENWQNGSIIIAPYGKGYFVYTGLSFFRQLPAGVPGAYRLFINLISQPVKP